MKIKNKAIKLLAGTIMIGFLSGGIISVPALAETTVATDGSVSDSLLLNDLQCSPVDIDFSPEVNTYRVVVPEGTEKILVSAQLSDPSSIYRVIGNSNLQSGSNIVTVEVEDLDGNKNIYKIQVIVGELGDEETTISDENIEEETENVSSETATDTTSREQTMAVVSSQANVSPSSSDSGTKDTNILDMVKGFLTDQKHFKWILGGIGAIVALLIILCIVLSVKKAKKKKISKQDKFTTKKKTDTTPVLTHDLSWTKENHYDEEKEDKILSDLAKSLKENEASPEKEDTKSDDEDDAFEIVDIDKL